VESECKQTCMDLDVKQTRRFYLAGTVAFPTPFPSAGGISIEDGSFQFPDDGDKENNGEKKDKENNGGKKDKVTFVVVQEKSGVRQATTRVVHKSDVAAIFFPGVWVDTDEGPVFRFAERERVHDLEEGEWFLGPQIKVTKITTRLKLAQRNIDITSRDSGVRGIVFVPEHRPVLTVYECAQTAGDAAMEIRGQCMIP
jgi:hypothetical protein